MINQKADIILLQETFWTRNTERIIKSEWKGDCYFDNGTNHSKGVAILINSHVSVDKISVIAKGDGRALALKFCIENDYYCITNVYSPTKTSEKDKFYKGLISWINSLDVINSKLIFGGDWNCVQHPQLDTQGISYPYKPKKWFKKFMKTLDLIDIWRLIHPTKKQFTWRQLSFGLFSRLDYWLISSSLQCVVQNTDIRPSVRCDHNAISLKIKVSESTRGRGYWKLNNSLLSDTLYRESIIKLVAKIRLEYENINAQVKWEMCKIKIREITQNSQNKSKK